MQLLLACHHHARITQELGPSPPPSLPFSLPDHACPPPGLSAYLTSCLPHVLPASRPACLASCQPHVLPASRPACLSPPTHTCTHACPPARPSPHLLPACRPACPSVTGPCSKVKPSATCVALADGSACVIRRAIPGDNSCLFNAIGYDMHHSKNKVPGFLPACASLKQGACLPACASSWPSAYCLDPNPARARPCCSISQPGYCIISQPGFCFMYSCCMLYHDS